MLSFELRILFIFLTSLFSVVFLLPRIANIAKRLGLLDHPNARKMHKVARPLVGGIGIVTGVSFASLLFIPLHGLGGYFLGMFILLLTGFLDDFKEMSHRKKFLAQITAVVAMISLSKVSLFTFGDLLGLGEIVVPAGEIVVWIITIFCVVGVTNAINLMDGLDGLAGGLSFIAFIFFAIHASLVDNSTLMLLNLALAGAILGFLKFNWSPATLFMGDAGSLCIGFSLAFMSLALTQGSSGASVSPIVALLILAVPITDTITVIFKRIVNGKNPFKPDKYHLHHIFLRYGMSRTRTVQVILTLSILLGSLSLLIPAFGIEEKWLFLSFAIYFSLYLCASFYITLLFHHKLRHRKMQKHRARSDMFLRLFFNIFDYFKPLRKAKRYNVDIMMHCIIDGSEKILSGQILNISQTGCMVMMESVDSDTRDLTLVFTLPVNNNRSELTISGEHLWEDQHEEAYYHGIRFKELTPDTTSILSQYLTHTNRKQSIHIFGQFYKVVLK